MFDFLKKKVNPFQIAAYLAMEPSKYMEGIEKSANDFLNKNPEYRDLRNQILDEMQWIIIACGVIAIRVLSDVKISKEVEKQLSVVYSRIHETNNKKTPFTSDFLKNLEYKIDNYLVRFNRGLVLRDLEKSSPEILFNEAMKDFANETMKYITGKSRAKEMTDWEDIDKLQERTEKEDELEQYIFRIIRQFVPQFREHFRNFKIEN